MAEKIYMTALSPTMENGIITEWHKAEGDEVVSGDVICEVETDKAVMEYESDFDAVLLKIIVNAGQSAKVGDLIGIYGDKDEDISDIMNSAADYEIIEKPQDHERPREMYRLKASPLARKMAAGLGIDISTVKGSGYDGRIIKRDIEREAESHKPAEAAAEGFGSERAAAAPTGTRGLSAMRETVAKRLSASKFSAPHYYLTIQADMSSILDSRADWQRRKGVKASLNSYLIKITAAALKKNPAVNSSWENNSIRLFETADIGFAVALADGLIAPVIRNCETKGIEAIDNEFRALAERAKTGKLSVVEYQNAGFTISNLGKFGIEEFTAIINPPGSAILAAGAVIKTPIVKSTADGTDEIVIKPMMKMTLSCDHRVIDGAVGAAFLADLKGMLENPVEALM